MGGAPEKQPLLFCPHSIGLYCSVIDSALDGVWTSGILKIYRCLGQQEVSELARCMRRRIPGTSSGGLPGSKKLLAWLSRCWQPSRTTTNESEIRDLKMYRPGSCLQYVSSFGIKKKKTNKISQEKEQEFTFIPWADKNERNHSAHSSYHKPNFLDIPQTSAWKTLWRRSKPCWAV